MIPELTTLTDIVAVKPDMPPARSEAGIWLPITDNLLESDDVSGTRYGHVIAIGPEVRDIKVGDKILYHRSVCAPFDFTEIGQDIPVIAQFLHEHEVLAVVDA